MFSKNTVELREAIETTRFCCFCNGYLCINEQCLYISDASHLNIIGHREAGYLLKSVGEITCAYAKMFSEKIQG